MTLTSPRNYLIKDVELNWARLDTPVENPFGGPNAWEVQIATSDKKQAKELTEAGLNMKEKDGQYVANLRRKSIRADGQAMEPVRVVDAQKQVMDGMERRKIGNGSRGNVIIWQAPYAAMGRSGISNSLTAVQVTKLEEYSGESGLDFDIVGDSPDKEDEIAF